MNLGKLLISLLIFCVAFSVAHAFEAAPVTSASIGMISAPKPSKVVPVPLTDRQILKSALTVVTANPNFGLFKLADAPSIRPGDDSRQIPTIRTAMSAFGYLPPVSASNPVSDPTIYDPDLAAAVRRFQFEVGLQDDGVIGNATRRALRAMDGDRALMIQQSLNQPFPRHAPRAVVINVAAGLAYALEDGKPVIVSRVIIGKTTNQTPFFSARIESVTLNPIWIAPESIVEKEFGGNPHVGRPGPDNPLGKIRIDMPNRYEIFLHSTNHPRLFHHDFRAYSHGCIRVEQIEALAHWLVGDAAWKAANADLVLTGLKTVRLQLDKPIPVYLEYRTATVASTGQVIYHADPYALAAPPAPIPPATGVLLPPTTMATATSQGATPVLITTPTKPSPSSVVSASMTTTAAPSAPQTTLPTAKQ